MDLSGPDKREFLIRAAFNNGGFALIQAKGFSVLNKLKIHNYITVNLALTLEKWSDMFL